MGLTLETTVMHAKTRGYLKHCSPQLAYSGAFKSMEILNEEHSSLLSAIHWSKKDTQGKTSFLLWNLNFQNNNSTVIIVTVTHQEPCTDTLYFYSCF